jgi:hypothetical protein
MLGSFRSRKEAKVKKRRNYRQVAKKVLADNTP